MLSSIDSKVTSNPTEFQIEQTGLYKILYLNEKTSTKKLEKISEALSKIPSKDLNNKDLISLLAELFTPIAHLIKESDYEHEKEYRLMHIRSLEDNEERFIKSDTKNGVYIDTGKILFDNENDKEVVYFGPKVDTITFLKAKHAFKLEGVKADLKPSEKKFR
jgi:hypothetical protein